MPGSLPLDVAAEEADARAEDHLDVRTLFEHAEEGGDLGQRRGQIGVPEADDLGIVHRLRDPAADRLRLPAVALQIEHVETGGAEEGERAVGAAVVDEEEVDAAEVAEGLHVETLLFVVAGDDDGDAHGGVLYGRCQMSSQHVDRIIETKTHGRYLVKPGASQRLLVGFHGYGQNAEIHLADLEKLDTDWTLVSVQGLHRFYSRGDEIAASWMTRQDRELAIADNIEYVGRVLDELKPYERVVFAGFSQGVAMAYRAANAFGCDGLIILAGDVPPEIPKITVPVLLGRGKDDTWYTDQRLKYDLKFLSDVTTCVFDGGHEWSDEFRAAAREFLSRLS